MEHFDNITIQHRNVITLLPGESKTFSSSKKLTDVNLDYYSVSIKIKYSSESIDFEETKRILDHWNAELDEKKLSFSQALPTDKELYAYDYECKKAMKNGTDLGEHCEAVLDYIKAYGEKKKYIEHLEFMLKLNPLSVTSEPYTKTVVK